MKWRVLVLLVSGFAMIYFVSLLQDTPYPHPVLVQTFLPKKTRTNEPSQVILRQTGDYVYRTHVHDEAVLEANKGFVRGIDSIKLGVNGLVIQARKPKQDLLRPVPEEEWEVCFRHLLPGPITQVSSSPEDTETVQFAVLYHIVQDDHIQHIVRVYYLVDDQYHYKDLILPGNTMIDAISLEKDSILFSRNPDLYRFRIMALPTHLTLPPHSEQSQPILLSHGQTGEPIRAYHQPKGTNAYAHLLSRLYSVNENTYRVFTLDIHKTSLYFHTNVSISDGIAITDKFQTDTHWIRRDHLYSNDSTIMDDNLEYMAFVDGAHFHHERTVINMPIPSVSRSKDAKTMVVSLIRNDFQTLDFTDNIQALYDSMYVHLYRDEQGQIMHEFYHTMQVPDSIEPYSSDTGYDATDIRGVQLNAEGTLLAVWTESNAVYIYKRGSGDKLAYKKKPSFSESPHHLEKPLAWILRMVISPKEGHLGSTTPIGAAMFWQKEGSYYLSVGMRNSIVNTYSIDEMQEQKAVSFQTLFKEKWDLWLIMTTVMMIFVVNEYKTYP
ncbi:hypothetical protein CU098_012793 [Rhizopus stolonifer]|uniref:Uncharacterized protein n=1 Tax=Rhizopus stolonifer TaxID=4846 RepID=A0A367KVE6_RHIST|nr:hypothetical protein CU098_012793 [Rhizopus stolonifer]